MGHGPRSKHSVASLCLQLVHAEEGGGVPDQDDLLELEGGGGWSEDADEALLEVSTRDSTIPHPRSHVWALRPLQLLSAFVALSTRTVAAALHDQGVA